MASVERFAYAVPAIADLRASARAGGAGRAAVGLGIRLPVRPTFDRQPGRW